MNYLKSILKIIFLLSSFQLSAGAQSLVLCEKYDDYGSPTGVYSKWDIDKSGGSIYILYREPAALSSNSSWYLYIDKDWNNSDVYTTYGTLKIYPQEGKSWVAYDYRFTEGGKFKVSIQKDGQSQASTYFEISIAEAPSPVTATDKPAGDVPDTYYYENSKVFLCSSLDENKQPVDVKTVFSINGGRSISLTVYITNNGIPFKTNQLFAVIYDDAEGKHEYDSFKFDVEPQWDFFHFPQEFILPGSYLIDIYNENETYINSSSLITIIE